MPRLYTRTGDGGSTFNPFVGGRTGKHHPCIHFLGALDEAEAAAGFAAALLRERGLGDLAAVVERVHDILFRIGFVSYGAEPAGRLAEITGEVEEMVDRLYRPVKSFQPSYASTCAGAVSAARAAVRRAERWYWACLEAVGERDRGVGPLLNRVSDLLFAVQVAACRRVSPRRDASASRRPRGESSR